MKAANKRTKRILRAYNLSQWPWPILFLRKLDWWEVSRPNMRANPMVFWYFTRLIDPSRFNRRFQHIWNSMCVWSSLWSPTDRSIEVKNASHASRVLTIFYRSVCKPSDGRRDSACRNCIGTIEVGSVLYKRSGSAKRLFIFLRVPPHLTVRTIELKFLTSHKYLIPENRSMRWRVLRVVAYVSKMSYTVT